MSFVTSFLLAAASNLCISVHHRVASRSAKVYPMDAKKIRTAVEAGNVGDITKAWLVQ